MKAHEDKEDGGLGDFSRFSGHFIFAQGSASQVRGGLVPDSPLLELPAATPPLPQHPHQLRQEGGEVVPGRPFLPRRSLPLPQAGSKGGSTFGDRVICDPLAPKAFHKANDHPQPLHLCCDGGLSHTSFILPCTALPINPPTIVNPPLWPTMAPQHEPRTMGPPVPPHITTSTPPRPHPMVTARLM